MKETTAQTVPRSSAVRIPFSDWHAQVYHVRCGRCGATLTHDVACDALRTTCPSCNRRLTLPATIRASCHACGADNEYPHTLAGHSTKCQSCDQSLTLEPVVGKARSHRHTPRRGRQRARSQHEHTLAYSGGAERSLILLVAAIATLIFVVAVSVL